MVSHLCGLGYRRIFRGNLLQEVSGAHLNPAVTLAMLLDAQIGVTDSLGYVAAGAAAVGAALVYLFYREHFHD